MDTIRERRVRAFEAPGFLTWFDESLAEILRQRSGASGVEAARKSVERALDVIAEYRESCLRRQLEDEPDDLREALEAGNWRAKLNEPSELEHVLALYHGLFDLLKRQGFLTLQEEADLRGLLPSLVGFLRCGLATRQVQTHMVRLRMQVEEYLLLRGHSGQSKRKPKRGRPQVNWAARQKLVADWKASGLTRKEFCTERGLRYDAVEKAQRDLRAKRGYEISTRRKHPGAKTRVK